LQFLSLFIEEDDFFSFKEFCFPRLHTLELTCDQVLSAADLTELMSGCPLLTFLNLNSISLSISDSLPQTIFFTTQKCGSQMELAAGAIVAFEFAATSIYFVGYARK
jgi:hypothetical protein